MNDDVRKFIYGTLMVFLFGVLAWIGILYINACGFTFTCKRGALPVDRTPIPTYIPATLPVLDSTGAITGEKSSSQCHVAAVDFIGGWADAGASETDVFQFTDANGQNCESTFAEVKPLFLEGNLWYMGSLSCVSCHAGDVAVSPAQLDLSTYQGITAGSRRADAESNGMDILSSGNWESSILYDFISVTHTDVPGHEDLKTDLQIFAGTPALLPEPTATQALEPKPTATP